MTQYLAHELNEKVLCNNCYYPKIESEGIEELEKHIIHIDEAKAKWPEQGSDILFHCDECGDSIHYDLYS